MLAHVYRSACLLTLVALAGLSGCGLNVTAADLFVLQRSGAGPNLSLLISDAGTVRCGGAPARPLPGSLLLAARDLADTLDKDVKAGRFRSAGRRSVFSYVVKLQDGAVAFADTDARGAGRPELARTELLAAQVAQRACGLPG